MSEQSANKLENPEKLSFYVDSVPPYADKTGRILGQYCKLPRDRWDQHVSEIRDKAWKVSPYPCVGAFWFLLFAVTEFSQYDEILTRLKSGQQVLDVGAGIGQELRAFASDGAPPDAMAATDYQRGLWDIGYDLFLDRGSFSGCNFIEADFVRGGDELVRLHGKFDVILAMNFLHLFDIDVQTTMAERMLRLLRPVKISLIVGLQAGTHLTPRFEADFPMFPDFKGDLYRHSIESIQEMWKKAAMSVGLEVETTAETVELASDSKYVSVTSYHGEPACRLNWSVRVL